MVPAVEFASLLIPELTERGSGGPLFAGRLSSVVPLPPLGGLALASAALRNYAITLNAALQPAGIYAGTIFTPYEPRQKQLSTRRPARGVVDCTGSPNRAARPSLNVT